MSEPTAYTYAPSALSDNTLSACPHCSYGHVGVCPKIKSVEYHPDGTLKRIEFHLVKRRRGRSRGRTAA